MKNIIKQKNISNSSLHYRLQKLGLSNNYCTEDAVDPRQVEILHNMGLTSIGIALLLQTSVPVISQHLEKRGLKDNYYRLKEIVDRG